MRVTSSATTNGRTLSVELGEEDVPTLATGMSPQKKHQVMMVEADMMVIRYMLESEQISNEYAQTRMREIQSRSSRVPV